MGEEPQYKLEPHPDLDFYQNIDFLSAKLRGAYLNLSCDIEFILADIACICMVKDPKFRDDIKAVFLEESLMKKKIEIAEKALKRYNATHYNTYKECFNQFKTLNKWRNKFAHSTMKGDDKHKDLSIVYIRFVENGEIVERKENFHELLSKLPKYASFVFKIASELIPLLYFEQDGKMAAK